MKENKTGTGEFHAGRHVYVPKGNNHFLQVDAVTGQVFEGEWKPAAVQDAPGETLMKRVVASAKGTKSL